MRSIFFFTADWLQFGCNTYRMSEHPAVDWRSGDPAPGGRRKRPSAAQKQGESRPSHRIGREPTIFQAGWVAAFEPCSGSQKKARLGVLFSSKPKAWYVINAPRRVVCNQPRPRLYGITRSVHSPGAFDLITCKGFALDYIPSFGRITYSPFGADYIHLLRK